MISMREPRPTLNRLQRYMNLGVRTSETTKTLRKTTLNTTLQRRSAMMRSSWNHSLSFRSLIKPSSGVSLLEVFSPSIVTSVHATFKQQLIGSQSCPSSGSLMSGLPTVFKSS